ncbi:2-hydroxy-6-oxo-6-phenylhexa-2,4-dienoate hydrolase [Serratia grimesii]|jgi:pimeloyl-ACP methyl ester carboxylesterase|uniref:alpha/beta fold hydrolase n=1 Tax=Serratia grimesii TaxID=82995 RepID=UPI00076F39F2|nr:alpha/beta hydrolase [Serratia grimesii]CAI2786992.1 2-hydroxy-6-oxo-6-phenylhexa-2,4-dienoate hydrolase [Serratia grimesii]CUW23920.1 2-hydroxy-6-oxo-6-phenylhexa-2%2C4-dienoate hydrolase [Serratia grimesii]SMZ58399.1 2-hydroxy-6-oxo-6-phenylhexa-2,4-dienoate hydrolase [Serratia grimesii]
MNGLAQRQQARCGDYTLSWREAGHGRPVVLLHGISSGSASWIKQFNDHELADGHRLLAWDAPGYGGSLPLTVSQPDATAYAAALAALVAELQLDQPLIVGHSLGALIGSAYAAGYPDGLCGLVLADPAQGYASAPEEKRQQVYGQRKQMIETLGPQGYGEQRAAALLCDNAEPQDIAWIRHGMQQLDPDGFLNAAWMLANDEISHYLAHYRGPLQVWCGDCDRITPPAAATTLAQQQDAPLRLIEGAGHASYLDAPVQFNRYLQDFTGAIQP